jgi:hypothetical protein
MLLSKKGAALLQVLLVTAVLAGIASLMLRATISRSTVSRQTRRIVSSQVLVDSCAAEVNVFWGAKIPVVFARDVKQCIMYCKSGDVTNDCIDSEKVTQYTCQPKTYNGTGYTVKATMSGNDGNCRITYEVQSASTL